MLVSLKWLRDYVDLPADLDVDDLAHRLTMASAEVEGVHRAGAWDRDLVRVGQVLRVEPHPDADRLRLATVDYGGAEPQRVVCGAPNLAEGQRIAFAREGAELIDGHTGKPSRLKAGTIRGVVSAGMVLSEMELGLSQSHEGILVLPQDAPIGTPLADYLGDTVLDVHVWPNRADTMNMVGIAREVAAILGPIQGHRAVGEPDETYAEGGAPASDAVSVAIEDPALCARYVATVIEGVTVGPSPEWMQARLRSAGMRPISNVVDITNYVMLELGQPLHAFDADRVSGGIEVRLARAGEALRTLDGIDRALTPDTLLITDASGPIALAGVMGGAPTEVTEATTRVLLEAARFDPVSIRRTSFRLALRSEASSRFERGLSPELAAHASRRATKLFVELCGGTARSGSVDVYPLPADPAEVTLTRARLDTLVGVHVPTHEVESILHTLGFEILQSDEDDPHDIDDDDDDEESPFAHAPDVASLFRELGRDLFGSAASSTSAAQPAFRVRAPWWRTDIAIPDDIAEEVVRLAGYDRLPASAIRGAIPAWEPSPLLDLRERMRDALAAAGMQEVITYSLTTPEVLARVVDPATLEAAPPLRLRNTLSADRQVLRTTLRHAVLETLERSLRTGAPSVAIFEAARVFLPRTSAPSPFTGEGGGGGSALPEEREQIAAAVTGVEVDRWGRPGPRALDFYDAKGMLESAFAALHVDVTYEPTTGHGLMPGRAARLLAAPSDSAPSPSASVPSPPATGGSTLNNAVGEGGGAPSTAASNRRSAARESLEIGVLAEVHPQTLAAFDIEASAERAVVIFEVDLPRLLECLPQRVTAREVPRFPAVEQDLALVVDEGVSAGAIRAALESSALVSAATVFDVFRGGTVPAGKKSVAFAIRYQAPDRTLTSEDAAKEQQRLLRRLEREFGAELRG